MENKINTRRVALDTLDKIEAAGQYSNIALDTAISRTGVLGSDRGLLTALVYGVIEKKITLDYVIDGMSSIPPSKIEKSTRNILRMGLYQLAFLDRIPDHAAINESVSLAGRRSKGFVNALLRGFVRNEKKIALPEPCEGEVRYLSVKYSVSEKVVQLFLDAFGRERAESLLSAMDREPHITLRVNTLKISRDEMLEKLVEAGIKAEKTAISDAGIRICEGAYSDIPGESEGLWFVQDEASQICAAVLGASAGETVIDSCSCPGGKSFSAAIGMGNKGRVMSFDLHENKLSLVRAGAERLGIDIIETAERDGKVYDASLSGCADRLICDVPCSGLGVIAKKPDIRYKNDDIERLPLLQREIAKNCSKYLRKGGVMVYSTCTVLPKENEENVKVLLSECPELYLMPFEVCGKASESGMLTLYPDRDKTDGFFIAKLGKR